MLLCYTRLENVTVRSNKGTLHVFEWFRALIQRHIAYSMSLNGFEPLHTDLRINNDIRPSRYSTILF